MHEHLQHVDRESKTLLPTHALEHFPRELRCRKVGDAHVEVELFGERTENFALRS